MINMNIYTYTHMYVYIYNQAIDSRMEKEESSREGVDTALMEESMSTSNTNSATQILNNWREFRKFRNDPQKVSLLLLLFFSF